MYANSIQPLTTTFKFGRGILLTISPGNALVFLGMLLVLPEKELLLLVWATFNLLGAMILFIPYNRGKRWAWYAIWILVVPYALLIAFNAERGPAYLGEAFVLTIGQLLTFRTFFSGNPNMTNNEKEF